MLLYRICKHSEIEYPKLLAFNKVGFEKEGDKDYGSFLKSIGRHVTTNCYKNRNKKPFKSFSKCPILLYSYLKRTMNRDDFRKLSMVAIEIDESEMNTFDCTKGIALSLDDIKPSEALSNLQITRLFVDLTRGECNKTLDIPLNGIRSKYGKSRAEVVIYNEKPKEIILELPVNFFVEVFDKFLFMINSSGKFKIKQQNIAPKVWTESGIDKRENTDRYIRKATYAEQVYNLINDCTKDMPSYNNDDMLKYCPLLVQLKNCLDHHRKLSDNEALRNNPLFWSRLQKLQNRITTDWCRGHNCPKYYC